MQTLVISYLQGYRDSHLVSLGSRLPRPSYKNIFQTNLIMAFPLLVASTRVLLPAEQNPDPNLYSEVRVSSQFCPISATLLRVSQCLALIGDATLLQA